MSLDLTNETPVTLNLFHLAVTSFQGPFCLSPSGFVARWMLKQVQHDVQGAAV
jgi:hypothetical protein